MLTRLVAPSAVVTLAEAKDALRIYHTRDDDFLTQSIAAAIEYLDGPSGVLGQLLGSQQWAWKTAWFTTPLRIPLGPVATVDSVKYLDTTGVEQTLSSAVYYLFQDARGPYLALVPGQSWPATMGRDDAVTVTFTGGISPIPAQIKSGILLLTSHLNQFREEQVTEQTFPTGFGLFDLIAPYRRVF